MSYKINTCERSDENEISRLHNSEHNSPTKVNLIVDHQTVPKNFFCSRRLRRCPKFIRLVCMMVTFAFLLIFIYGVFMDVSESFIEREYKVLGDFIVDTHKCRIPNISPFSKEAMNVFKPVRYQSCSTEKPLVSLQQFRDNDSKILIINNDEKNAYLSFWHKNFECCYKNVYRSESNESADMKVEISSCRQFNMPHQLDESDEFILVECAGYREFFGFKPSTNIYKDAFAIIRRKESVNEKLKRSRLSEERPTTPEKFNVFFFGIDSISRLNLIRALPKTYKHVESTGWLEFRGYNKMEDNTFPNLMAILTGHNLSVISDVCDWRRSGELENCEFMWNLYDTAGYVTAYAEDEVKISTFNYFKTGFTKPPTDYYFRPLGIATEDYLEYEEQKRMVVCLGRRNYADYIYDYGVDFATTYPDDPKFGFFWTNSFSHEDLSYISSMDEKVKGYLEQWEKAGILNSSIVFFFSDHGMRFGDIRKYFTGWLEERLPFLYIWVPLSFREKYPHIVKNLKINRDRLISPYDVHVTLKDILKMSGGYNGDLSANSCPTCQSLFVEIPTNRSCEDAGVDKHWCTCTEYLMTDAKAKEVKNAVNYVLKELNNDLKKFPKCAQLRLHSIHSARKSSRQQDFLISFKVKPSDAELEVTVRCEDTSCENLKVVGSISRLNRYGDQSFCINDAMMRKYCYCT